MVVCHEFVQALSLPASKRSRLLKWTQLSANQNFHSVLKTEILKLFVEVWCLLNFGMTKLLCFHNTSASCDLWQVLMENGLIWGRVTSDLFMYHINLVSGQKGVQSLQRRSVANTQNSLKHRGLEKTIQTNQPLEYMNRKSHKLVGVVLKTTPLRKGLCL